MPVITIHGKEACGVSEIGKMLAKELCIEYVDNRYRRRYSHKIKPTRVGRSKEGDFVMHIIRTYRRGIIYGREFLFKGLSIW